MFLKLPITKQFNLHFTLAPADDELGVKKIAPFPSNVWGWGRLNNNSMVKEVVEDELRVENYELTNQRQR